MSEHSTPVTGLLGRWAQYSARHAKRVLAGWLVLIVVVAALAGSMGGSFVDSFKIPGAESQKAIDLLGERFPSAAGDSATMVFQAPEGVTAPETQAHINEILAEVATLPEVLSVASPFDTTSNISADGTIAYATIQYDKSANEVDEKNVEQLLDLTDESATDTLKVEVGGQIVSAGEQEEQGTAELIGIAAAVVILFVAFGSLVAMGLPILTALVGVALGFMLATIGAGLFDLSSITTAFISMIGLGVGIDYALFIVTRFREARHEGQSVEKSVITAVNTAGRAVLFAGTIVIIALLGLSIIGIPFVMWMGLAGAMVVALSMIVANGLLPALLTVSASKMDKWTIPTAKPVAVERTVGYRLVTTIQRKPWLWLIAGTAIVGSLAFFALDARIGSSDAGNNSEEMHTRRAYDLLATGFGPGFNGPLLVVVNDDNGVSQSTIDGLTAAFTSTNDVAAVSPASFNETGDTAIITVIPGTSPQDKATEDLIGELRDTTIPSVIDGTSTQAFIGGGTATFVDMGEKISSGLILYILLVAGLSIIVLMAVFRSIVIPIKAAVLNLFSFAAAYGVLVLVFQKGYLADLIGVDRTGPIESFVPMILFGILFGLSMDYEVFLVSRVHESWMERKDNNWALSHGIGKTGRVVMAAGAIMVSVFAAFALGDSRVIKEFGIGLASAIFIDVAIVRMIIVPAFMTIAGKANWWFPAWLDRILPRLDIEGSGTHHAAPAAVGQTAGAPATINLSDGD
ncbi:MMPL family transporter [soil metagenome]